VLTAEIANALSLKTSSHKVNLMNSLLLKTKKFFKSEDGPTAVEYAVMLALIVIVCLTAIRAIGTNASTTFQNVSAQLGS
jgi:pilus assembly protein Flp/PilA